VLAEQDSHAFVLIEINFDRRHLAFQRVQLANSMLAFGALSSVDNRHALSIELMMQFLDLRTILAMGGFVAYAAALAMALQALKSKTFRVALWTATCGLLLGGTSLIFGSLSNVEPSSVLYLWARIFGTFAFLSAMCALVLMFRSRFPVVVIGVLTVVCMVGFSVFPSGQALLNWSSFCQTMIAGVSGVIVFLSTDQQTPKLRRSAIFICCLVAVGPAPHLYTSIVNSFGLNLPLFDNAAAYRFRIVLNVTVLVLGYSCMNALAQARDALQLHESINYDLLTGAHSRRFLFNANDATTVLLLDIDHFKRVNDQWGHHVGDQVLKHCVVQIREVIRQSDAIVARYGGEEFCIVVPKISFGAAASLAERVREKIQNTPCVTENATVSFTVSIGISHRTLPTALSELIRIADEFLYAAKRSGRNQVNFDSRFAAST
jgi:diguanylate cyclase (GGDEF)-like protein